MVVPGGEQGAVRSFYAAWTAGDVDAMLAIADPGIEAAPTLGLLYDRHDFDAFDAIQSHVQRMTVIAPSCVADDGGAAFGVGR